MSKLSPAYLVSLVVTVVLLMFSAIIHEVAHGWVAYLCGDTTAKDAGRLTLNPFKHLDPFGSVILPLIMAFLGGVVFAFAKPVPYNPYNLKHRRRDEVFVSLAGPASNIIQALIGACAFRLLLVYIATHSGSYTAAALPLIGQSPVAFGLTVFSTYVWVNLMLCFFNLIPLPPLDGSKIICYFLKGEALEKYYEIQRYAMPILLIVLYILPRINLDPVGAYLNVTAGSLFSVLLGM